MTAAPGLSVLIHRPGHPPARWTHGLAHLETATPITRRTAFTIGSTTKQITAHLALLAARDNLLNLTQQAHDFLPDLRLPDVTVAELITHHSGIRDTESLLPLAGLRDLDHYTADDLITLATRQHYRAVPPGTFLYSSTNYLLLARILQHVHQQPLDDIAHARLFEPLGMSHTHFRNDPRDVITHTASAYTPTTTGWRSTAQPAPLPGAGSLTTTPEDLSRWLTHLHHHWQNTRTVLPLDTALAYRASDHHPYLYGPGLYADPRPATRQVFHSGHEHGFSTAAHLTAAGEQLICMSNHAGIDAAAVARTLIPHLTDLETAQIPGLLAQHLAPPPPPTPRPAEPGRHTDVGSYRCADVPGTLRLTSAHGHLHLWRRGTADRLTATTDQAYAGPGYTLTLHTPPGARPPCFTLDLARAPGLHYTGIDRDDISRPEPP
ncbi:serine hydrolase domain-containing protein [Streptomyces californicus]|uniref:serine hydrolase domain-containing protein n=1 Tax=Streptomyces californicus TaxID=67351 RepID=UPI0033CB1A34